MRLSCTDLIRIKNKKEGMHRRTKVLAAVREALQPVSMDDICNRTGISYYSVNASITSLLAERLVAESKGVHNMRLFEPANGKEFQDILFHRKTSYHKL